MATNSEAGAQRRRLESEMLMYQADRAKLLREKEAVSVELRVLKKELDKVTMDFSNKKETEQRLVNEIQNVDTELLRLRKRFNLV